MTTQVHWGVSIPMVCQRCRRPVETWMIEPRTDVMRVRAECHGEIEIQTYEHYNSDVTYGGIHPAVAFPMPKPWGPAFPAVTNPLDELLAIFSSGGCSTAEFELLISRIRAGL